MPILLEKGETHNAMRKTGNSYVHPPFLPYELRKMWKKILTQTTMNKNYFQNLSLYDLSTASSQIYTENLLNNHSMFLSEPGGFITPSCLFFFFCFMYSLPPTSTFIQLLSFKKKNFKLPIFYTPNKDSKPQQPSPIFSIHNLHKPYLTNLSSIL